MQHIERRSSPSSNNNLHTTQTHCMHGVLGYRRGSQPLWMYCLVVVFPDSTRECATLKRTINQRLAQDTNKPCARCPGAGGVHKHCGCIVLCLVFTDSTRECAAAEKIMANRLLILEPGPPNSLPGKANSGQNALTWGWVGCQGTENIKIYI